MASVLRDKEPSLDLVGLVPAAGRGNRIAPLPCSKELYPIGFHKVDGTDGLRPKVVSHHLLENMRIAGVRKAYFILRQGKWDIPAYWGDGQLLGIDLAYVVIEGSTGPPDSIDRAYAFIKDKIVAFGFPDILFRPTDVFAKLLARLNRSASDVVLGLFPAHDNTAMDMVDIDARLRVRGIHLKPRKTKLKYAWLCAVWTPAFTEFLHHFLGGVRSGRLRGLIGNRRIDATGDIPVGAVLRAAVQTDLKVEGVTFPTGRYLDIGTPRALSAAQKFLSENRTAS
jgi:NDP-sugar pyrophosphorylase family protein